LLTLIYWQEPLWENKCLRESHSFSEVINMSNDIEKSGNWLYFDYKHIGETVDENIFKVSSFYYLKNFFKCYVLLCLFYFSPFHGKSLVTKI